MDSHNWRKIRADTMAIEFLNADLEITSDEPLEAIRVAFAAYGQRFNELYCTQQESGIHFVSFESHPACRDMVCPPDDYSASAEEKITAFCDAIGAFPSGALELWFRARDRVIDLGYESTDHTTTVGHDLDVSLIKRLDTLKIKLEVTIHPRVHLEQVLVNANGKNGQ